MNTIRKLEAAIAHLSKQNYFDKRDMVSLLKEARDELKADAEEELARQAWQAQQEQDEHTQEQEQWTSTI